MAWITTQIVMKKERVTDRISIGCNYCVYKRYRFLNWFKFDRFIACGDYKFAVMDFVKTMNDPKVVWEEIIN